MFKINKTQFYLLPIIPTSFFILYKFSSQNSFMVSFIVSATIISSLVSFLLNNKKLKLDNDLGFAEEVGITECPIIVIDKKLNNIKYSNKQFKKQFNYYAEYGNVVDFEKHFNLDLHNNKYGVFNFNDDSTNETYMFYVYNKVISSTEFKVVQFFNFNYAYNALETNIKTNNEETINLLVSLTTGYYQSERKKLLEEGNIDTNIVKAADSLYHAKVKYLTENKTLLRNLNFYKNRSAKATRSIDNFDM